MKLIQYVIFLIYLGIFVTLAYFVGKSHVPIYNYNLMHVAFQNGQYEEAIDIYNKIGREGQKPEYKLLLGWSYFRLAKFKSAEQLFKQVLASNPKSTEAQFGVAYIQLNTNREGEALLAAKKFFQSDPHNPQYALLLAESYFMTGNNEEAANTYAYMVENELDTKLAAKRYQDLFGDPSFIEHSLDSIFAPYEKPKELKMSIFRTQGDYFQIKKDQNWAPIYLTGINLSATPPGHAVTEPSLDVETYKKWFLTMKDLNINALRIYTILPPAFYRAFKEYNETNSHKIWLLQGIWFKERSLKEEDTLNIYDLYDASWIATFEKQIEKTIDAIHGRANIPYEKGEAAGFFTVDVSPWLFGYVVGRELEPYLAYETNKANPQITSFQGNYFTLTQGNATEVWIARMCEYVLNYENHSYNEQHLLSFINWPPLDTFNHPSEGSLEDLKKMFLQHNIPWTRVDAKNTFDADIVSVDTYKIKPTHRFENSYFITYHVYPSWPSFIFREEPYRSTKDELGPNPWYGYLVALKQQNKNIPFLLAEFGLSTSWVPSHFSPGTWDHGGLTEKQQGEGVARMIGGSVSAGCAGCCLFEFQDSWWKITPTSAAFDIAKTKPYWLSLYNAEESYGVLNYTAPPPIPLLRGEKNDWANATHLAKAFGVSNLSSGKPKVVKAYSDATFFYICLEVVALDKVDWRNKEYWIALSTLPDLYGSLTLESLDLTLPTGANFLIKINKEPTSKILISSNYNPFEMAKSDLPFIKDRWLRFKPALYPQLNEHSSFEEILYLTNGFSYARNGYIFSPIYANRSILHYGTADPSSDEYMSHAAFHIDEKNGMIELRLPWAILYMLDPSNHIAMGGIQKTETQIEHTAIGKKTNGFAVVAIEIEKTPVGPIAVSSLPEKRGRVIPREKMKLYTWEAWLRPPYTSRLKKSYNYVKAAYEKINNEFAK